MTDKGNSHADQLEQALENLEKNKKSAASIEPQLERLAALNRKLAGLPQSERRKVLDAIGLKHVSAAPEPITPLRGSSYIPQYKPTELVTLAVIESQATTLSTALALAETTAQPAPAQDNTMLTPMGTEGASDGDEVKPGLQWWEESYDIPELWQNIGARLHSQKRLTSNTAIAKEIEKRINEIQKGKGLNRVSPNWDTIRGKLYGWKWKTD